MNFELRLFVMNEEEPLGGPEIGVHIRPEEWLDLIDAMKQEFEKAQKVRKEMEDL